MATDRQRMRTGPQISQARSDVFVKVGFSHSFARKRALEKNLSAAGCFVPGQLKRESNELKEE